MKAVGYIRVSTEEQTLSPEVQRQVILDFASAKGIEVVEFFEDIGVSGSISCFLRPGFKKMLEYCEQNGINIIVAYSLDRLTRNDRDFHVIVYQLIGRRGYKIVTVREGEFSRENLTPDMRMLLQFRIGFAKLERYWIRLRTRDALSRKCGNSIPPELEEKIIAMFKQGYSIHGIARTLNISRKKVYFVLWKHGLWSLPEDTCPRCLSKMEPDEDFVGYWYCRRCGFLKPMSTATTTTNVDQMGTEGKQA